MFIEFANGLFSTQLDSSAVRGMITERSPEPTRGNGRIAEATEVWLVNLGWCSAQTTKATMSGFNMS